MGAGDFLLELMNNDSVVTIFPGDFLGDCFMRIAEVDRAAGEGGNLLIGCFLLKDLGTAVCQLIYFDI